MGAEQLHSVEAKRLVAAPEPEVETPSPAAPVPISAGQLVVGHAEDRAEHDADRRADTALSRLTRRADDGAAPDADAEQHQHGPGCSHLRRAPAPAGEAMVGLEGGALDAGTSRRIESSRGRGNSLPDTVRSEMEEAFDTSFSGVRIHTDSNAAGLNRLVSARAFTTGKDIFFGAGEYQPDSPGGKKVLAHELAHTMQQDAGMHRWPWSEKDPVKLAEKEKAKQEKADKKAELKKAKDLEKTEAQHLKGERKRGTAEREKLKSKVDEQMAGKGKTEGSEKLSDLKVRFEKALKDEEVRAKYYVEKEGKTKEEAIELAYKEIWLDTTDEELRAVRPPRETESERLAREIRAARTDEAATNHPRGELLSPEVEVVYEAWEVRAREIMDGPPKVTYAVASAQAENEVWALASAEVKKKRPTDGGIERRARQTAKVRTKNGTDKNSDVTKLLAKIANKEDGVEKAEKTGETVEKVAGILEVPIGGVEKLVGKIGSKQDNKLQSGITKAFETSSPTSKMPVIGELSKNIEISKHAKKIGASDTDTFVDKDTKGNDLPTSVTSQASEGIGKVTGIFKDLISGANAAIKMVKAIREANEERDTIKILAATKATADAAGAVGNLGKDTAELAKFIDAGVAKSVGSVIPGFNIAIAVTSVISNTMTLATSGLHLSHANDSLTEARVRKPGKTKVDVMVAPLLHMTAGLTKTFEKAVWSTTQAVSSLVTSIATVATAGGFGIPAAVDSGMKLLDMLHNLGHFIADNVLAVLAQRSREASVAALEGAAEGQFKRDPAMAVDGITMQAKKGDTVAQKFLEAYGFPPSKLPTAKLTDVREAVLKEVGEDADPLTVFQSYKKKIGGATQKWKETGELAKTRNEDGKGRGFFWRVKMALRSDGAHKRSLNKTKAQQSVVCRVGSLVLYDDAVKEEKEQFLDALEKVDLQTILNASKDPKNSEEWRKILHDAYEEGLAKGLKGGVKSGSKAGAGSK